MPAQLARHPPAPRPRRHTHCRQAHEREARAARELRHGVQLHGARELAIQLGDFHALDPAERAARLEVTHALGVAALAREGVHPQLGDRRNVGK